MSRGIPVPAAVVAAAVLLCASCSREAPRAQTHASPQADDTVTDPGRRVLVVSNTNDPESGKIASVYSDRRQVPPDHRLSLPLPIKEEVSAKEYRRLLEAPIRAYLKSLPGAAEVDFMLLIRGVPLRVREGGYSVDALLAAMDLDLSPITRKDPESFQRSSNPYFGTNRPFRRSDYWFFLFTRLDGYTAEDALRLIDSSTQARPKRGLFLLDLDPRREKPGYAGINDSMRRAARLLRAKGFTVRLDESDAFVGADRGLAGYYSWGSNDGGYERDLYRSLDFLPGAIAETAVSSSARTFRPTDHGQSLIADLIHSGVTGVKGYVSEPLVSALAPADLLFDRYTSGYTLAESFYMAIPFLRWKDVVIGDPLAAPYAPAH